MKIGMQDNFWTFVIGFMAGGFIMMLTTGCLCIWYFVDLPAR